MSNFNCDFNAPQFFDFTDLTTEGGGGQLAPPDDEEAKQMERYFAFDHEAGGIPVNLEGDKSEQQKDDKSEQQKDDTSTGEHTQIDPVKSPVKSGSSVSSGSCESPLLAELRRRETPKRRSIREAVAKTIETVNNSPKVALPPSRTSTLSRPSPLKQTSTLPRPSPLKQTSESSGKVSKNSPGIQRWKKAIKSMMTPDILRKARALNQGGVSKESGSSSGSSGQSKVGVESGRRLAAASTTASQARSVHKDNEEKHSKAKGEILGCKVTQPAPFRFATDLRKHQKCTAQDKSAASSSQPLKANVASVDFTKMLRTYIDQRPGVSHMPTYKKSRRRSRSVDPSPNRSHTISSSNRCNTSSSSSTRGSKESLHSLADEPRRKVAKTESALNNTVAKPFSFVDSDLARVKEKAKQQREANFDYYKNLRLYEPSHNTEVANTKVEPFSFESRAQRRRSRSVGSMNNFMLEKSKLHTSTERIPKAKPAPHFGVPVFLPQATKKATQVQPFSFEERDAEVMKKKQEKIEKIFEEEKKAREFKAQPMPDLNKPVGLPIREVLLPTQAEPFNLEIEKRVESRIQKWEETMKEELQKQKEAANFKANPATVLYKDPFVPQKSDKSLAEISNFELHSERRARERETFEQYKKQKEAELESRKRLLEDRRREEEEEEIRRQRREAVHKAQPVKQYKTFEIHSSDKPLTKPESPKFSQMRSGHNKPTNL